MKITDKLTYLYLRKIKKWMFCPNCNEPTLKINKAGITWFCSECGYKLDNTDFEDDYVFWFCDKCNTFLNIQEGFDINDDIWFCDKCGCLNDISLENLTGICKYCGKDLENPDQTICEECKTKKLEEIKNKTEKAQSIIERMKEELR